MGSGATDFAYEHGLIVLPEDGLISDGARERWHRWQRDLEIVEASERQQHPAKYHNDKANSFIRGRGYNAAQLAAIANGARTGGPGEFSNDACHPNPNNHLLQLGGADGVGSLDGQPLQAESSPGISGSSLVLHTAMLMIQVVHASARSNSAVNVGTNHPGPIAESEGTCNTRPTTSGDDGTTDNISDTVGAIAVDCHGNIAAGSSSGGIGMKHRGRIGPAALVGIGTAVVPVDPNDPERTCVASVTSGTGEHIATTLAASTCASRVYYNERKTADGAFEEVTEDEAMRAMIDAEFMGNAKFSLDIKHVC